jgi:hypothetical protein
VPLGTKNQTISGYVGQKYIFPLRTVATKIFFFKRLKSKMATIEVLTEMEHNLYGKYNLNV